MKVKDLQIGSLVYCESIKRCAKVIEIYKNDMPPFFYMVRLEDGGLTWCVPLADISPIGLTPEILEKNGFKKSKGKFIYYDEEQGTEINLWLKNYGRDMPIEIYRNLDTNEEVCHTLPQCFLVHELQHTLRLCHLADIADHFKI